MNVCHVISGDLWAGAEVQAFTLLIALAEIKTIDLSVIVLNEGKLTRRLREAGIKTSVIDESRLSFSKINKQIANSFADNRQDILHSHRIKENVLAGLAVKRGDADHAVTTIHGLPESKQLLKRLKHFPQRKLEERLLKKQFDKLLPVSDDIGRILQNRFGDNKVRSVHNAFDFSSATVNRTPDEIKAELGLHLDQPIIGTAGRMVGVKRYDRFLETAKLILKDIPEAVFIIAGDGPLLNELKMTAKQLGLANRVIFTGFRKDIIDLINCFDLFLISSEHEGIPMVVLEAMYLKKPVVGFKVGGLPEIINKDECGILVEPENCVSLADGSVALLKDNSRKQAIGLSAHERIKTAFSVDRLRTEMHDIYKSLVN